MCNYNIFGIENARAIVLYDLDLPLEERRKPENLINFTSTRDAASYLGVVPSTVFRSIGKRIHSKKLNKTFAVREPKKQKQ